MRTVKVVITIDTTLIKRGSPNFRRATWALCLGSIMVFANLYALQPLLPTLAREFQLSALQASYAFTITSLTLGLSLLFYGALSDAYGRRPLMLLSLGGVVMTTFSMACVETYSGLLLTRALLGLFLGGLPAIAVAYMGDEYERSAMVAAVGLYISANTLGGISGRLLGGTIGEWLGWSSVFGVMGAISLLCLGIVVWLLPKAQNFTPQSAHPRRMLGDILGHIRNPFILLACLIGGFNFFIFVNQYSYVTFLLAAPPYELSPSWLGLLFLTYLSGTFAAAFSGRIAQYFSPPRCLAGGIVILIVGSLLTLISYLPVIIGGFFVNAFGFFFAQATATGWVSNEAKTAKASASALYLVFYYVGATLGGFYLFPFWQWLAWPGVILGSIIILLSTLSCAILLQILVNKRAQSI